MGRWDKGIENNGGIIYMNGGHIETSGQGEYSYAIYNEGGTVEISEGAVTLPRNYGVDQKIYEKKLIKLKTYTLKIKCIGFYII